MNQIDLGDVSDVVSHHECAALIGIIIVLKRHNVRVLEEFPLSVNNALFAHEQMLDSRQLETVIVIGHIDGES